MRALSLEEAVASIRALPSEERETAIHFLTDRVAHALVDSLKPAMTIFDPLECTPARAGRCHRRPEMFPLTNEVCAVFVDEDCTCPHAASS